MTSTSWNCARNRRHAGTGFRGQLVATVALQPRARSASLNPRYWSRRQRGDERFGGSRKGNEFTSALTRFIHIRNHSGRKSGSQRIEDGEHVNNFLETAPATG